MLVLSGTLQCETVLYRGKDLRRYRTVNLLSEARWPSVRDDHLGRDDSVSLHNIGFVL